MKFLAEWLSFIPQWVLEHRGSHDCDDLGCKPYKTKDAIHVEPTIHDTDYNAMRIDQWGIGHHYQQPNWKIFKFSRVDAQWPARGFPTLDMMTLETAVSLLTKAATTISGDWRIRNRWTGEIIPADALGLTYENGNLSDQGAMGGFTASSPAGGWSMGGSSV